MTMQLIETKTLGTAAASIEFTSIPQDGTDLLFVFSLRSARATIADDIVFRFNGDTGSNYSWRSLLGTGSSTSSSSNTEARGYLGLCSANNSTANVFGNQSLYIPNYTSSTAKSSSVDSVSEHNGTESYQVILANRWSGTASITSFLVFSANSANFIAGSTVSLYKITKGSGGATVS
jgi:hypothetical protein